MKINLTGFIILAAFSSSSAFAQAKTSFHLVNTFHIASTGGWDYLAVSPVKNWLYVSHGGQVNILDKKTGDSIAVIENTTGVHGIAFNTKNNKGYTSNGRLNNVTVFDLSDNKPLGQIATGTNPDAIMYEPFSDRIITCNGRSNNLSFIDPEKGMTVDSVPLRGKPETAVSDGTGKLFVNIEDKSEISCVDLKTMKVLASWSLQPGESPTGLAMDVTTKRLFAGCEKMLIVLNAESGKIVARVPIGDGCDGVAFDPSTKNIFTSNGEGSMTVIHEETADKFSVVTTFKTKQGGRTICLDPATHMIYIPTAEFDPNEKNANGRPKMIAGTFQVLAIAQ